MRRIVLSLSLALLTALAGSALAAESPYCEVVKVSGDVQLFRKGQAPTALTQGTKIEKGDTIVTAKGDSSADVAFDADWQNISHIGPNSRVTVRYFDPGRLELKSGDIYAKLERLPKGSSFEVATPTAVAVARGTRYRTTYADGKTTVYNDSETSLVYVYKIDENGNRTGRVIVLKPGESVTVTGSVQLEELMPEELQDARDREDQDQLSDDLDRTNQVLSGEQPDPGNQGGYGEYL